MAIGSLHSRSHPAGVVSEPFLGEDWRRVKAVSLRKVDKDADKRETVEETPYERVRFTDNRVDRSKL